MTTQQNIEAISRRTQQIKRSRHVQTQNSSRRQVGSKSCSCSSHDDGSTQLQQQLAAAESTEFGVTLEVSPDDKKIGVIKVVREITGLGLKEAKDIVDGAPKVLKETAPKAEAEEIAKKIASCWWLKATLKGL